jgi:hypothetical protein
VPDVQSQTKTKTEDSKQQATDNRQTTTSNKHKKSRQQTRGGEGVLEARITLIVEEEM